MNRYEKISIDRGYVRFLYFNGISIFPIVHPFSCRIALRPAVLTAARIRPSVSRHLEISFGLRGLSPQTFTSFVWGWVHRPAPEAPLIRGMPTGPLAFLGMPGVCRLRPCAWAHQKKALCQTSPLGAACNKYRSVTIKTIAQKLREFIYFPRVLVRK